MGECGVSRLIYGISLVGVCTFCLFCRTNDDPCLIHARISRSELSPQYDACRQGTPVERYGICSAADSHRAASRASRMQTKSHVCHRGSSIPHTPSPHDDVTFTASGSRKMMHRAKPRLRLSICKHSAEAKRKRGAMPLCLPRTVVFWRVKRPQCYVRPELPF